MEVIKQRYEESVPLDALKPHPLNPNLGDEDVLDDSINANGFYGAVLAQEGTGLIVAGHHRWKKAREKGADGVPVIWADVDDEWVRRVLAVDNESTRRGHPDRRLLAELLSSFGDAVPAGTGYDQDALNSLLAELARRDEPPSEFPSYDEAIKVDHECPRCGYAWS